jgi:hypothetical protein
MSLRKFAELNAFYLEKLESLKNGKNEFNFLDPEDNIKYREQVEKSSVTLMAKTLANIYGFTLSCHYGNHAKAYMEILTGVEGFLSTIRRSYEKVGDYSSKVENLMKEKQHGIEKN